METREPPEYGLALSGGGFRAAFFHIGVLARLAEIEVLPKIEVISTVSGGSIVGALYYVHLKKKLEETRDGEIGRAGYMALVAAVERDLRRGVQKDIRGRVFANPWKNMRMAVWGPYSRSDRIGDLYDRHIYRPAWGSREPKWDLPGPVPEKPVELRELLVQPLGEEKNFRPKCQNKDRQEKVPILLINATSLNSGHNWRFEAIRMGESLPDDQLQAGVVREVDKNMRLEPGYFEPEDEEKEHPVPDGHAGIPLAKAVAASAGVPGVFQPLALTRMYAGVTVQLVDGGVQDNQGVQGLFDRRCKRIIVSDASGQMNDKMEPSGRIPGVVGRSGAIARDRVRDEQLFRTLTPDGVAIKADGRRALMHLRMGVATKVIPPVGSPVEAPAEITGDCSSTEFHVATEVQEALSEIRTDLDRFSDTEAFSLELDGYQMSCFELDRRKFGCDVPPDFEAWTFAEEPRREALENGDAQLKRKLKAGKQRFFRFLWVWPPGPWGGVAMIVAALAAIAWLARDRVIDAFDGQVPLWSLAAALVLAVVLGIGYGLNPRNWLMRTLLKALLRLVMILLGLVAAVAAPFIWLSVVATEFVQKRIGRG